MNSQHVRLVDRSRNVWAEAQIVEQDDHFGGIVDLRATPGPILTLFEEFEEVVNGQMFVFLDEIQGKIDSFSFRVIFNDGVEASVKDLQVFPSSGELSFRLADLPSTTAMNATPDTRDAHDTPNVRDRTRRSMQPDRGRTPSPSRQ